MADERKFLHDLSTPIATLTLVLENAFESTLSHSSTELVELRTDLEQARKLLSQIHELIHDRKTDL